MPRLYVANLTPNFSEEEIAGLLSPFGQVDNVNRTVNTKTGELTRQAFVDIIDEASALAAMEALNGYVIDGERIAVTYAKVPEESGLTPEGEALVKEISEKLGENEKEPIEYIKRIVRLGGISFSRALLEETLQIEADGGMSILSGERRRTPGGVFFFLARKRLATPLRSCVFWAASVRSKDENDKGKEKKGKGKPRKPRPQQSTQSDKKKPRDGSKQQPGRGKPSKRKRGAPSPLLQARREDEVEPPKPREPRVIDPAVREHLQELQQAERVAQQEVNSIKTKKSGGLFTATKKLLDIQSEIRAIYREYPELKNRA
jgi:RNA recognition motif-containing protein